MMMMRSRRHTFSRERSDIFGEHFSLYSLFSCSISIKSTIKLTKIINNSSFTLLSFRNNDIITELAAAKTTAKQSQRLVVTKAVIFSTNGPLKKRLIRGGQVVGGCGQQLERIVHERRPGDSYDYSGSERENRREDGVRGFGIAISVFLVRRGEAEINATNKNACVQVSGYLLEELRNEDNLNQFKTDVENANVFIGSLIFIEELAEKIVDIKSRR